MDGRVDGEIEKLDDEVIKNEKLGKRFGKMARKIEKDRR